MLLNNSITLLMTRSVTAAGIGTFANRARTELLVFTPFWPQNAAPGQHIQSEYEGQKVKLFSIDIIVPAASCRVAPGARCVLPEAAARGRADMRISRCESGCVQQAKFSVWLALVGCGSLASHVAAQLGGCMT